MEMDRLEWKKRMEWIHEVPAHAPNRMRWRDDQFPDRRAHHTTDEESGLNSPGGSVILKRSSPQ